MSLANMCRTASLPLRMPLFSMVACWLFGLTATGTAQAAPDTAATTVSGSLMKYLVFPTPTLPSGCFTMGRDVELLAQLPNTIDTAFLSRLHSHISSHYRHRKHDIVCVGSTISVTSPLFSNGGDILIYADSLALNAPVNTRAHFLRTGINRYVARQPEPPWFGFTYGFYRIDYSLYARAIEEYYVGCEMGDCLEFGSSTWSPELPSGLSPHPRSWYCSPFSGHLAAGHPLCITYGSPFKNLYHGHDQFAFGVPFPAQALAANGVRSGRIAIFARVISQATVSIAQPLLDTRGSRGGRGGLGAPPGKAPGLIAGPGGLNAPGGDGAGAGDVTVSLIGSSLPNPIAQACSRITRITSASGGQPGISQKHRTVWHLPVSTIRGTGPLPTVRGARDFATDSSWPLGAVGPGGTFTCQGSSPSAALKAIERYVTIWDGLRFYDLKSFVKSTYPDTTLYPQPSFVGFVASRLFDLAADAQVRLACDLASLSAGPGGSCVQPGLSGALPESFRFRSLDPGSLVSSPTDGIGLGAGRLQTLDVLGDKSIQRVVGYLESLGGLGAYVLSKPSESVAFRELLQGMADNTDQLRDIRSELGRLTQAVNEIRFTFATDQVVGDLRILQARLAALGRPQSGFGAALEKIGVKVQPLWDAVADVTKAHRGFSTSLNTDNPVGVLGSLVAYTSSLADVAGALEVLLAGAPNPGSQGAVLRREIQALEAKRDSLARDAAAIRATTSIREQALLQEILGSRTRRVLAKRRIGPLFDDAFRIAIIRSASGEATGVGARFREEVAELIQLSRPSRSTELSMEASAQPDCREQPLLLPLLREYAVNQAERCVYVRPSSVTRILDVRVKLPDGEALALPLLVTKDGGTGRPTFGLPVIGYRTR